MSDGFSQMIATSRSFFTELAATNTKEWFEPRKEQYQSEIRKPAELLAELFSEEIARLTGKAHNAKVYRINRDVRFSKDKSPYNAHLHVLWSPPGDDIAPGWFFAVSPQYLQFAVGIMDFGDRLDRYRKLVDARGEDIVAAMAEAPEAKLEDWGGEPLKRVPKPYPEDHPHGDLLKRKNLILSVHLAEGWDKAGVMAGLQDQTNSLLPFWRLLNEEIY